MCLIETASSYAAADAEIPLRLMPVIQPELERQNATRLLEDIEMPLVTVLADMERTGIALDQAFLRNMSGELSQRLSEIENQVFNEVGSPFNLNSTQQLSKSYLTAWD